jgi:hypothetical protein
MRLKVVDSIYFGDIQRRVPLGIVEQVSKEFLFFTKETCNAARRDVRFASIYDNPDYSERSFLTPVDAVCYACRELPCVLIFIRPERCSETTALHELMHAYLYFAEGYDSPRTIASCLPFHVRLLAKEIGNIAMDLHTNKRLKRRGFPVDSLREEYFKALRGYIPLMKQSQYSGQTEIQWQIAAIWAHMLAGAEFYCPTERNLAVHRRLERVCRRHCPATLRFRDTMLRAYKSIGYDTPEEVGRVIDNLAPRLFAVLGEGFQQEYVQLEGCAEQAAPGVNVTSRSALLLEGVEA